MSIKVSNEMREGSMKRIKLVPIILSLFAVGSLSVGCLRVAPRDDQTEAQFLNSLAGEEITRFNTAKKNGDSKRYYNFILGELAINDEDLNAARGYFQAVVDEDDTPSLRIRLAEILLRTGMLEESLEELEKLPKKYSEQVKVLELKAGILSTLHRYDEAIKIYKKLIDLPITLGNGKKIENEDAYILLSSIYAELGKADDAEKTLNSLLAKRSNSVFALYYLARVKEMKGDFKEAESNYLKALELSPGSEAIRLDLARSIGLQKRIPEAISVVNIVLQNNPQYLPARELLGQLLLSENKVDDALREYENLGKLEQDPTETRFKIALIKLERRDFEGAAIELNLILAKQPKNSSARYYLALVYSGQGKSVEALEALGNINLEDKLFAEAKILTAYILRQQKRSDEALAVLREASKLSADRDIRLLSLIATAERELGEFKNAATTYKKIVLLDPRNDAHYFSLGAILDEAGESYEAVLTMRRAVDLNPRNANALNYLGYSIAEGGGDLHEAENLVKRALALEPNNGFFIDSIAWVYYKQGKLQEALKEMERAIVIVPDDAVFIEHLAIIVLDLRQYKRANQLVEKALALAPESEDKKVAGRLESLKKKILHRQSSPR